MHVVRVPYNLTVSAEAKIHDKLLRQGSIQIHLAPWMRSCIRVTASIAPGRCSGTCPGSLIRGTDDPPVPGGATEPAALLMMSGAADGLSAQILAKSELDLNNPPRIRL